jgi:hypothetical protein
MRTSLMYIALVVFAVGLCFGGAAVAALLYIHAWLASSEWGLVVLISAIGLHSTNKKFSI